MKKIAIPIILIVLTAFGFFTFLQREERNNNNHLTLYGNVDIRDVSLGFRVSGRIETLNFEEGDEIKKGDILAILDQVPFKDQLNLRKAELSEAEAFLTNAEKLYERRKSLVESGAVSQSSYDDALAARDETKARLDTASVRVKLAETQLEDTKLLAPNNGTILTRVREEGAIVKEGQTVYTLALQDPVWVRTYVGEPNLGNVFEGQKAIVKTDSGETYEGQVGFISPQAEFTPKNVETTQLRPDLVYRLRVIVNNPNKGLRQGMPVTVLVEKRKPGN